MIHIQPFVTDPVAILRNRKDGVIYTADFTNGTGRYVSSSIEGDDPVDAQIKISPRVEVRLTYIFDKESVQGIQITKLSNRGQTESVHLSTLDWIGILSLLKMFTELDLKALAQKSLILNESIIQNSEELETFLKTISADPQGKEKLIEIVKNFGLLNLGDIDEIAERKEASKLFDTLLNNAAEFENKKTELGVGKNEEVWQRFFKDNPWILGTEFVEILDERVLDPDNITDYIVKSYDGFADIIELKLPTASFWNADLTPNSDLSKAIMQCMRYIYAIEKRINDLALHKKIQNTAIVKPRITLIYGRSNDWGDDQPCASTNNTPSKIISFHSLSTILAMNTLSQRISKNFGSLILNI